MTTKVVSIRGLDTLLFRDGRPFDLTAGGVARGMTVPFPSTLAGFIRTQVGRATNNEFEAARAISIAGPLLSCCETVLFAAPADVVPIHEDDKLRLMALRPHSSKDAGCDNPGGMLPMRVTEDGKPATGFEWWNQDSMFEWLEDRLPQPTSLSGDLTPPLDERVHITMAAGTGTTEEGKLFSTAMTTFERSTRGEQDHLTWSYLCNVSSPDGLEIPIGPGLLGGEQRIGFIESSGVDWPACPASLKTKLASAKLVRLVLATPAVFTGGWLPSWLDKATKTGSPPGLDGVTLKLVGAAVPRRQAVSGWEMEGVRPKPTRWLAPAGSVYFFEVAGGDAACLADSGWLASVSDEEETRRHNERVQNNRNDGFGLALWGVWKKEETK